MTRAFDFNSIQESLGDVTLRDKNRTVLHLDIPTEGLVNEMLNVVPELQKIKDGNQNNVDVIYDIAARLLSCNSDYIKIDPAELPTKYGMNLVAIVTFFKIYMGFLSDLSEEKN